MNNLVDKRVLIEHIEKESGLHIPEWLREVIFSAPPAHIADNAYQQGVIEGRVQMRTELLTTLKEIVGVEAWSNI